MGAASFPWQRIITRTNIELCEWMRCCWCSEPVREDVWIMHCLLRSQDAIIMANSPFTKGYLQVKRCWTLNVKLNCTSLHVRILLLMQHTIPSTLFAWNCSQSREILSRRAVINTWYAWAQLITVVCQCVRLCLSVCHCYSGSAAILPSAAPKTNAKTSPPEISW